MLGKCRRAAREERNSDMKYAPEEVSQNATGYIKRCTLWQEVRRQGIRSGKVQQALNRDSKRQSGENVEMAIVKRSWFPKWKTEGSG